jgi:hypothetical protein
MGDKFTIQVSTGDLSAAETLLGDLARNIEEEGTKLANLPGKAASWTGTTATTLKAEMTRIAGQMKAAPEHFTTAKTAVGAFRGKIEDAQTKTLPDLNRRWNDSIDTYISAVGAANRDYSSTTGPFRHMPDADSADLLADARQKRDGAISSAATARDDTQRRLTGEYDTLVGDLQAAATACGSALAGAVLAAVPAEVISTYLAGGGMGPGILDRDFDKATAGTRQALTGDESLAGRADDLRAGEELAKSVKDKIGRGEPLTADEAAYLKANARNAAFVEGFMTGMGPEALAALSYQTLIMVDGYDDEKEIGRDLKDALTDVYTTGSHIKVDDGHGGERYLMDEGWLDDFNPKQGLPDVPGYSGVQDVGYDPGSLLPFLTKPLSANFSKVVGERWLKEYEEAKSGDPTWFHGRYTNAYTGEDVSGIVFDRIGDHADVSNDLMTAHHDTFMGLMTGKDPYLTGDEGKLNGRLNKILEQAVLGIDPNDARRRANADYIVAAMGQHLARNDDDKLIKEVLPGLGKILASDHYIGGQIMSVATPFAPDFDGGASFPAYSRDPQFGLLMDPEVWAQLQQEAMRSAPNVTLLLGRTKEWVDAARTDASGHAWSMDGPDGQAQNDNQVIALDLYQQEAVRSFFAQNLSAVREDFETSMAEELEEAGKPAEYAQAAAGKIFEWVSDPKAAPGDIAAAGVGLAVKAATDLWTSNSEADIKAAYDKQIKALNAAGDPSFTDPGTWDDINTAGSDLATQYEPGRTPASVWAESGDQATGAPPVQYTGDPRQYVGHDSEYVGGGGNPVITDDFLVYENGKVTGIVPPSEMNHLQRAAYSRWLHDPAVQKYLDENLDAVENARGRAAK